MNINLSKGPHIIFFVFFLGFLSIVSSYLLWLLFPDMPFWMETLSPLASYGIFFWLFDKYAWKWNVFKLLGVSRFPDLNGRWKGLQKSSYKENDQNVEVVSYVEIRQTFSKIYVSSYYEKSQSSSVVASFADFQDETFLYYTYDNEPNSGRVGTMQKHRGTVKLRCISNTQSLSGRYFNDNGNDGEIDLEYIGKELSYKFGANS